MKCTLSVRIAESLDELIRNPVPTKEQLDALALGGVGLALVPGGSSDVIITEKVPFVMDPMLPPEEIPEGKAVVQRSVNPDSSYGYKKVRGRWPIEDIKEKLHNKIVLNPFWVTTWEVKLIKLSAFIPELGPRFGISSPIPPELIKSIYSSYTVGEGPEEARRIAELLTKSHYWSAQLRAEHLDSECWRFAGYEPPSLKVGSVARFVVRHKWIEYYVNGSVVLYPEDLKKLVLKVL